MVIDGVIMAAWLKTTSGLDFDLLDVDADGPLVALSLVFLALLLNTMRMELAVMSGPTGGAEQSSSDSPARKTCTQRCGEKSELILLILTLVLILILIVMVAAGQVF